MGKKLCHALSQFLFSGIFLLLSDGCTKSTSDMPQHPEVIIEVMTNIKSTTAQCKSICSDGGAPITAKGVCWSTTPSPTTESPKTSDSGGAGVFMSSLTGLTRNTIYYVRAYAINRNGTGYSNEVAITTAFELKMNYGGGIIGYLDDSGRHGLINSPTLSTGAIPWGCDGAFIGSTLTTIGSGQANTLAIINGCGEAGIPARVCNDLVLNGYDDWFLPSKDELSAIYHNDFNFFEFQSFYYSSSEFDTRRVWACGQGVLTVPWYKCESDCQLNAFIAIRVF